MPPILLLFPSYSHALTILQLSVGWSPEVLGRQTSESPKLCSPSSSPYISTCSRHSNTQTSSLVACQSPISHQTACLCFNAINSSTPAHLSDLHLYSPSRSLRSSADTRLLKIPLYKCKAKGDSAFSHFGPSVWNSLPLHIRNATTIDTDCSKNVSLQPPRS